MVFILRVEFPGSLHHSASGRSLYRFPVTLKNFDKHTLCSNLQHSWRKQSPSCLHQSNSAPQCCMPAPHQSSLVPTTGLSCPHQQPSSPQPPRPAMPQLTECQQQDGRARRRQPCPWRLPQHLLGHCFWGAPSASGVCFALSWGRWDRGLQCSWDLCCGLSVAT